MTTEKLGRLEPVDLRLVWESEPGGFTPWLAHKENLTLLGETLDIELECEGMEKGVGPFRADILCKDTRTGAWVLIENQLERTDHCHLGQLLTYAAGLKAVTIVWIAERFTEEHRAALDWLNEITGEDFTFFGLEIELWRISDSPPAPKFNVVCKPNDWSKAVKQFGGQPGEMSETSQLQYEFWQGFGEFLRNRKSVIRPQKPSPQSWAGFAIGRSGFTLVATVNVRDSWIGCSLAILGPSAHAYLTELENQRDQIEQSLAESLNWRRSAKQGIIELYRDAEPTEKSKWPEYFEWLAVRLERLHKVFGPRVKTLSAEPVLVPSAKSE